MSIGTAPLIDKQRDQVETAADVATVARLERDLIAVQKERIAELEAEVRALREVVVAVEWAYVGDDTCPRCYANKSTAHFSDCPYSDLYAAGYLPAKEMPK